MTTTSLFVVSLIVALGWMVRWGGSYYDGSRTRLRAIVTIMVVIAYTLYLQLDHNKVLRDRGYRWGYCNAELKYDAAHADPAHDFCVAQGMNGE